MSDIETLRKEIKGIRIAMLTTVDQDGSLRSRPMGTQEVEFDGDLWFFISDTSPKADEVRQEQQVNVSYADTSENRYVSVSGRAAIVHDKAKMKQLWNPLYKVWFSEGLDTPDIALLRVTVTQAEYWDAPAGKLVQLVGFVKAVATGDHDMAGSRNEKLTLK